MSLQLPRISAFLLVLGVACGAFGAHGLRDVVPPNDLQIWEKAVFYHLLHALAAFALATFDSSALPRPKANRAAAALLVATAIFSGTLYMLVLTNTRWLGAITPLGGLGFMLSWGYLAVSVRRPA